MRFFVFIAVGLASAWASPSVTKGPWIPDDSSTLLREAGNLALLPVLSGIAEMTHYSRLRTLHMGKANLTNLMESKVQFAREAGENIGQCAAAIQLTTQREVETISNSPLAKIVDDDYYTLNQLLLHANTTQGIANATEMFIEYQRDSLYSWGLLLFGLFQVLIDGITEIDKCMI